MKDRILKLMQHQGMTQKEFAGELCISEGTLSSIYTGRTKPTNNIVSSIHECFPQVSISWLMFGEGDMFLGTSPESLGAPAPEPAPAQAPLYGPNNMCVMPQNGVPASAYAKGEVKYVDVHQRKIKEIRVFYDDGTYEVFPGN